MVDDCKFVITNVDGKPAGVYDTSADAYDAVKPFLSEGESTLDHIFPAQHFKSVRTLREEALRAEEEARDALFKTLLAFKEAEDGTDG